MLLVVVLLLALLCSIGPQGAPYAAGSPFLQGLRRSPAEERKGSFAVSATPDDSRGDPSVSERLILEDPLKSAFLSSSLQRFPSAESLATFADSLVVSLPSSPPPSASLVPARSTPSLSHDGRRSPSPCRSPLQSEQNGLNGALHTSKSTPNLEDSVDEDIMVTKKLSMYSYLQDSSVSTGKRGSNPSRNSSEKRYWDHAPPGPEDNFNQTDYAHHLRSSSYQILHSRQLSNGSYHSRQHSNTSNYSEGDEVGSRSGDLGAPQSLHHQPHNLDRSRCFSFDSLGLDNSAHQTTWNISEPDLSLAPPLASSSFSYSQKYEKGQVSPSPPAVPLTSKKSPPGNGSKLPSSPPPPPVRDASSLKYIRYGPGHEKFPSWPVPAGATSLVLPQVHQNPHDANVSGLPDSSGSFIPPPPQGSHRSHSWTEQSEYPKEKCGGYARPFLKRQFSPSFQKQLLTVMEKCEKISPDVFKSRGPDDILRGHSFSLIDSYLQQSTYYPPFDREGRCIDDKDYSIPSPPERDPGMGEAHLSQVTAAQLEEHARRCDYAYGDYPSGDFPQITPLLDQLRQESYTWDGASERDSGRGESESLTDSRYSNGRESVTTVVTNSSSASSSETLKWHGSLSDVSIMSGHSKEAKSDHNIVHSARVQPPQRQNSESVLYYGMNGRGKHHHPSKSYDVRVGREGGYPRPFRDGKWSREVERNNEVNNLKKFPSYSYTQPLSQISEAPLAESRESLPLTARSPKSPTIDFSKPPTVAERISELERQSRSTTSIADVSVRWPRDHSEPRDVRRYREELNRENNLSLDVTSCIDLRKNSSERDLRSEFHGRSDSKGETMKHASSVPFRSPSSSVGSRYLRSSSRRDSEDSMLSSDSSLLSFGELDRSGSSSTTSYTYLDPDKRCKVSDATLKSIQKQALLSFYERRTGKSFNAGSSSSSSPSHTSPTSPTSPSGPAEDLLHPEWAGKSLRGERGGRSGKGMARLGRVPDSDRTGGSSSERGAPKPLRRRSVSGREASVDITREAMTSGPDLPPVLPAKPQPLNPPSLNSSLQTSSVSEDDNDPSSEEERRSSLSRVCHDLHPTSPPPASSGLKGDPKCDTSGSPPEGEVTPSSLSLPADETPPKPPDRPPKKANLRSLFHPASDAVTPEDTSSSSPSRPYFYRKPPAPDPPLTPPATPPPPTMQCPAHLGASRSSTPDLPPPPPPITEEGEVVVSDEPLPPPPTPTEVPSEGAPSNAAGVNSSGGLEDEEKEGSHHHHKTSSQKKNLCNGTYHKDSYMAHRKEWKTGYEGRYRRTHSPTASDRNAINGRNRDQLNNNINNIKSSQPLSKSPMGKQPSSIHTNGNLRSAVSTSSLLQRPTSPLDKESHFNDNTTNSNNNNNGWTPHTRQKSTTVNFTAEELRAFKARRAAHEGFLSSTGELRAEIPPSSDPPHIPLRPLTRAFSLGEPLHIQRFEEDCERSRGSVAVNGDPSLPMPLPHDGPITAHPATVTEESTPPSSPPKGSSLTLLPPTSLSEKFNTPSSLLRTTTASLSPSTSPTASSVNSSTTSLSSSSSSSTLVSSSSLSSSTQSICSATPSPTASSTASPVAVTLATTTTTITAAASTSTTGMTRHRPPDLLRSLSSTGTCPSMTSPELLPEEWAERTNIVVLKYGRTLKAEVVDCDRLSLEFAEKGNIDNRLQALLAPRPPYKSMAHYMDGVFALEMRRDLLRDTHANHPDLHLLTSQTITNSESQNGSTEASLDALNGNPENPKDPDRRTCDRAPLPADSAYFTTSESKAKLLSRIRDSPIHNGADSFMDSQYLKKKKEELMKSISRKLEILKGEQLAIKEEMSLNYELGLQVTSRVELRAKSSESDKYKLHVEEIDKIASLLLGLSGRLARAENALLLIKESALPEERRILESKRDKLSEQLEEAKKLKENIDRRAVQVSRMLTQYLSEEEYADYDHFLKMKAKLIMDSREIDDKIKLGDEQLQALANTIPNL